MKSLMTRHEEHPALIARVLDGLASDDEERLFDEVHAVCALCQAQMLADASLSEQELEAHAASEISKVRFLSTIHVQRGLNASTEVTDVLVSAIMLLNGMDHERHTTDRCAWDIRQTIDPGPQLTSSPTSPASTQAPMANDPTSEV